MVGRGIKGKEKESFRKKYEIGERVGKGNKGKTEEKGKWEQKGWSERLVGDRIRKKIRQGGGDAKGESWGMKE